MLVRAQPVFFSLPSHGEPSVKLRILQNFTLYLRNNWSINLRAIENCICGLRSIERKMRSILRTVHLPPALGTNPDAWAILILNTVYSKKAQLITIVTITFKQWLSEINILFYSILYELDAAR
jgi:hypothetical protein